MSDKQEQVIIVKTDTNFGVWGAIIGFVGIFVFSIVLSPLAFILGLVGIFNGKIISGIFAVLFAIVGLLTSPNKIPLFDSLICIFFVIIG